MHRIERELLDVLSIDAKDYPDRQAYLIDALKAANAAPDADFERLSDAAQHWYEHSLDFYHDKALPPIPEFDELFPDEPEAPPTSKQAEPEPVKIEEEEEEEAEAAPAPEPEPLPPRKAYENRAKPPKPPPKKAEEGGGSIRDAITALIVDDFHITVSEIAEKLEGKASRMTIQTIWSNAKHTIRFLNQAKRLNPPIDTTKKPR